MLVAFARQAFTAVDIHEGQGATPDTTGVEGRDARLIASAFQSGPMAEDDLQALGLALFVLKPGFVARWRIVEAFLAFEVKLALGGAKPHAGVSRL